MKQYSIIIMAAALLATACTKDIEYNGPDSDRMLIVNSITESGDIPVLKISHSAFFLDSYYRGNAIKSGVTVNLEINGEKQSATYSDSKYGFTDGRAITEGDIISVNASHPDYGTVTASDTVPYAQDITFTEHTREFVPAKTMSELFDDFIYDLDQESVDSVWVTDLDIRGNSDKTDYYMITIEPQMTWFMYDEYEERYDTLVKDIHFRIPAETKVFLGQTDATTAILEDTEADSQFEYRKQSYIFDDLYIRDGNKLSFEFVMEKPDTLGWIFTFDEGTMESSSAPHSIADKIKDEVIYTLDVKLYVLSGAYYYYHKSVKDYNDAEEISFLSEPVTILHNVKGGLGILATYTGRSFHWERSYKFK